MLNGLLFRPFEDGRFSTGRGEYLVTNGRQWQWRILPDGEVFHIHAIAAHRGVLFAATSAWRGGLQRSDDGGGSWRVIYDHPTPLSFVSRLTELARLGDTLYAGVTAIGQDRIELLRMGGQTLRPVPGWPQREMVTSLTAYRDWLYGVNATAGAGAVQRTNGTAVERVTGLDGEPVRALAAGPDALCAVSASGGGGTLWRSGDGVSRTTEYQFRDAEPLDVGTYAGLS